VRRPRSTPYAELAAALVLALPVLCAAQSAPAAPELVTDRPGFGESSGVVERGTIQIETGLTLQQIDASQRQLTAPQLLARVGVAPRVELRVSADGLIDQTVRTSSGRARTYGRSDAEVGGKVKVLDEARAGVDVAVLPYVSVPTASTGFGSAHYDPGFKVAAGRGLPRGFGLSGTFNATDPAGDTGRAWQREISVSLDHGVGAGVGAYGEVDGAFAGRGCGCSVDGGVTVPLRANGQFDVEMGRRVHGPAQDWFVGAGFVIRRR
jgi:hypothetical protein